MEHFIDLWCSCSFGPRRRFLLTRIWLFPGTVRRFPVRARSLSLSFRRLVFFVSPLIDAQVSAFITFFPAHGLHSNAVMSRVHSFQTPSFEILQSSCRAFPETTR